MNKKLIFKLSIDLAMTALMLLSIAYQLTGGRAHEMIGAALFALFILHNFLNWRWYCALAKGKYDLRRAMSATVNMLLVCDMAALIVTSVMISRTLAPYLAIPHGFMTRQVHTFTAFWGLVLMSVHLGMHWEMILAMLRKTAGADRAGRWLTIVLRVMTALIFAYGVKSSFDLDVGSKLTMRATFSYWDFENETPLFFAAYLSIMGVYICVVYYVLKLVKRLTKDA
ncbi:MAG: DUF4405 domain-containing protein [Synergistaceae bacterium]|nr:DUF4405 domain-containing protein [Synergistaceae bacterium]